MKKRLPSAPPVLPGFSFLRVLGSGGFADVFLFEQDMPRRQVAVKVMAPEAVNDDVRRMFVTEANLMATLSAHPSILTVYQAGVSQDGRPFLVMEYCVASLGQRYRREVLPVADVLRVAVKVASAVNAAHEMGILHRDLKPGNILLTSYGNPVLSDFGIAGRSRGAGAEESVGLSIPWSSPEVLAEQTQGTILSEVYSLGATVYSLLAGRSPFERDSEDTRVPYTQSELMHRIRRVALSPIGRVDVPESLERCLMRSLAKDPESRQQGALDLVREFQAIETELGLIQTPLETAVSSWATAPAQNSGEDTLRAATLPVAPTSGFAPRPRAPSTPHARRRRRIVLGSVAITAAVFTGLGLLFVGVIGPDSQADIPRVGEILTDGGSGSVRFDWQDPGLAIGDTYTVMAGDGAVSVQRGTGFTAAAVGRTPVCITVAVTRAGRAGPVSAEKCASAS
jgi:serine/threonine protein kinase